jgi:carbon monoxide dehydrogenase subunit G
VADVRIAHEVEIGRPREEVFAYLSDPVNMPEWQSGVSEVRKADERHFREVRHVLGREVPSEVEVTVLDPPRRFDLAVRSGPFAVDVSHTLETAAGGTRLRVAGEANAGFFGPFVGRKLEKQVERDFAKLKSVLEGRSG